MGQTTRNEQVTWNKIADGDKNLKTMEEVMDSLIEYVSTLYKDQGSLDSYTDDIFINDILYGIGIALNDEYKFFDGYAAFKELLLDIIKKDQINTIINKERSMARPKPVILAEITDNTTYKSDQVLASEGVWAVYYEGRAINIKSQNLLVAHPGPKYSRCLYPNKGHAIRLAKKLNIKFKTDKFTVMFLTDGFQVYP